MADYVAGSIFDLLAEESLDSGSVSSTGSHHPRLECHMAEIHEGLVEDLGLNGESPVWQGVPPPAPAPRDNTLPPQTPLVGLQAQQRELQEARLALKRDRAQLECDAECHG